MISTLHTQGYYGRVLLAAAIGIALSVVAFSLLLSSERHDIEEDFEGTARDRALVLESSIAANVEALEDIRSLYKASKGVERHEFRDFIEHELEESPGIQALEWIPRVPASERATYEEAARKDGFPEFRIVEREAQGTMVPANFREEYFPVYYVEPYEGNEAALGFDLASNPIRLEALNKSRDTGQGVATARITLVQETEDQFGFLLFQPIYRKGFPAETLVQRQENLMGFALGVYRITDMLEHSLARSNAQTGGPGLDIQLYDRSAPPEQQLLFSTIPVDGAAGQAPPRLSFAKSFDVADRTWELVLTSPAAGLSVWSIWQPWAALSGGLLFTGLLSLYFLAAARRAASVERLVATRTVELSESNQQLEEEIIERQRVERGQRQLTSIVENSSDFIGMAEINGQVRFVNASGILLVGLDSLDEAQKKPMSEFIYQDDLTEFVERVVPTVMKDGHWEGEIRFQDFRTGLPIPMQSNIFLTMDPDSQQPTGLATVSRDVTDRMVAEEALRESEDRHRSIVDTAADGIITIDARGTIQSFNNAASRLFGYGPEEVVGQNVKILMPDPYHGGHDGYLANYLRTGEAQIIGIGREVVALRKDGTTFPAHLSVSEVSREAGPIFTGIVKDLTEIRKAEEVLRDELERAARIQIELLPSQSPTIPHFGLAARCVPARDVAGDFFDWQQRDSGTLDFVLCDVMGKGMPAALLMATVRSALRASAELSSPAQVLRQVEQAIGNDLRRAESFVTLFYGHLDIEERRLTYVDAGHGLGFIRRAAGSTEPLEGGSLPLGVFPDSELQESAVTLQEGDMVVLFTDGLVEAQDGTMLDVRTLLIDGEGFKNAETIVESLIEATGRHRSGDDDATVLILTCTSSG